MLRFQESISTVLRNIVHDEVSAALRDSAGTIGMGGDRAGSLRSAAPTPLPSMADLQAQV